METKLLEVRDEGTMISMLCVDMDPSSEEEHKHLHRCGYPCDGNPSILMLDAYGAGGRPASNDLYDWEDRTFETAHRYIQEHWYELKTGDVVDVPFILGETEMKKTPKKGHAAIEGWIAVYPTVGYWGFYPTREACFEFPEIGYINGMRYVADPKSAPQQWKPGRVLQQEYAIDAVEVVAKERLIAAEMHIVELEAALRSLQTVKA